MQEPDSTLNCVDCGKPIETIDDYVYYGKGPEHWFCKYPEAKKKDGA